MQVKIAENIRKLRKAHELTQEQLAEALGVTVGAVSKWELGGSVPDIHLIVELATFFETSVDVLLGYDWHKGTMGEAAARITALRREKRLTEAARAAEQALRKYPNSFDVVYQSAMTYFVTPGEAASARALELFGRACKLIDQNTDPEISLVTLQNRMAACYLDMGHREDALRLLKENNVDGLNNSMIGTTLAKDGDRAEEALKYLSDALGNCYNDLYRIAIGYANAYVALEQPEKAMDIMLWFYNLGKGLREPGKTTWLDKSDVVVLTACAELAMLLEDGDRAYALLKEAKAMAEKFDSAPEYHMAGLKFYHGPIEATAFDDLGGTAMDAILNYLNNDADGFPLQPLWNRLLRETPPETGVNQQLSGNSTANPTDGCLHPDPDLLE